MQNTIFWMVSRHPSQKSWDTAPISSEFAQFFVVNQSCGCVRLGTPTPPPKKCGKANSQPPFYFLEVHVIQYVFSFCVFWYTQKGGRIAVENHRFKTIHLEMGRVPVRKLVITRGIIDLISDWNDLLMIFPVESPGHPIKSPWKVPWNQHEIPWNQHEIPWKNPMKSPWKLREMTKSRFAEVSTFRGARLWLSPWTWCYWRASVDSIWNMVI